MKIAVLAAAMLAFAGAASACPMAQQAEAPVTKPAPTS
jgi:hypothetical protein